MYTNIVCGIVLLALVAGYNMTIPQDNPIREHHCYDMCWDTNQYSMHYRSHNRHPGTTNANMTYSTFVGLDKDGNLGQWSKAFERSIGDFLPILTLPS